METLFRELHAIVPLHRDLIGGKYTHAATNDRILEVTFKPRSPLTLETWREKIEELKRTLETKRNHIDVNIENDKLTFHLLHYDRERYMNMRIKHELSFMPSSKPSHADRTIMLKITLQTGANPSFDEVAEIFRQCIPH